MRALPLLLWLAACAGDALDDPALTADSGLGADLCADAPTTTWDNFGAGFVTQHCQSCHGSASPNRNGAPAEVSFDDEEQVWAWADRILVRATGEEPDMPPQGGVSDEDRHLLEVWLTCGG